MKQGISGISRVNRLEKQGQIAEALKVNIDLVADSQNNRSELLYLYQRNARRLFDRLSGMDKKDLLGLLGSVKIDWLLSRMQERPRVPSVTKRTASRGPVKVTVVIPCYNCEDYLPRTIESVARQTYANFECILVDDFSSDKTAEIARSISKEDKRFRFYQHRANGGLATSRNSGLRLSKGEYVCFLDSDDILSATSLANRAAVLSQYRHNEMVAGAYDFSLPIPDEFNGIIEDAPVQGRPDYADFISSKGDCPFNANQPMIKRSVLVAMGGFPEKYPQAEDWRLWAKIMRSGGVFIAVPNIGSGYRQTPGSMIRRRPLLHVEKSLGNYFRAHRRYGNYDDLIESRYEDIFFSRPLFLNEWGHYYSQQQFLTRMFNFTGIELGRIKQAEEPVKIVDIKMFIVDAIPDFYECVAGYTRKNLYSWMENGYKRFFGSGAVSPDAQSFLVKHGHEILDELFHDAEYLEIGPARRLLPTRIMGSRNAKRVDVVFFPHKEYHTRSFELLIPYLEREGLSYAFVDISVPYRDEKAYSTNADDHFMTYNEFVFSRVCPRSIVCMNDWDTVVRPVVRFANESGIPTIGIVEGVQDFDDMDTGRKRNPYREVSNVFLPGNYDKKHFKDTNQELWITGVQRLDGLSDFVRARSQWKPQEKPLVVVNVNFSYGVMTDQRQQWVRDIATACAELGYEMVVSQHPQDDGDLTAYNTSSVSLYNLLVRADLFISRFSGAILESLVIGCPVVYYKGHGVKVDKFHDSLGDYGIADTAEELVTHMKAIVSQKDLQRSGRYLKEHCDISDGSARSSLDKTVNSIKEILKSNAGQKIDFSRFKKLMGASGSIASDARRLASQQDGC